MSYFTQYKLKDGRKIRGRYDSKSTKVCISRSDLEGLIYEADVAYEQAQQLQTIIENLLEIKRQAITEVLDKIRAEIEQKIEQERFARSVFRGEEKDAVNAEQCTGSIFAYNNVIKIIDKYRESEDKEWQEQ